MRYYDITLTPEGSTTPSRHWTSHPNGQRDPGALDIEFDMLMAPAFTPTGGQTLSIKGPNFQDLQQATKFAGSTLVMRAGMQSGLPLANPAQAGVILEALVLQSYGNWQGTEMSLDFVLYAAINTDNNPGNFVFQWTKGQSLQDALRVTLSVAYPNYPIVFHMGKDITAQSTQIHVASTLEDLASFLIEHTEDAPYNNGVGITIQAGQVVVIDSTYNPAPIPIAFTDLIGQPTWIEAPMMQVKTVLRADIQIGSIITMPKGMQSAPGLIGTTAAALPSSLRYQTAFQNSFTVAELRHIGSFRSSDASSWCTIMNCVPNANI